MNNLELIKHVLVLTSALVLSCSSEEESLKTGESPSSKVLQDTYTTILPDSKEKYGKKAFNFAYKPVFSPVNINKLSTMEIKKMYSDLLLQDQQYRDSLHVAGKSKKQKELYGKDISRVDSTNQLILSALVHEFGWPSAKNYGKESVEAAFYITWHAGIAFKKQHLSFFEAGSKEDSLNLHYFKITKDYVLLWDGKEQMYHTHTRLANGGYQVNF